MPLISIIVPVYKVESFIKKCVDSLLSQTFANFDLIMVDDGSPDNCPSICDDYAHKDSRVQVIHQKNKGLSAARNAGIDWALNNSNSDWITFIDSDDWVHPQYLEVLLNAVNTYDTKISMCTFLETSSEQLITKGNIALPTITTPEQILLSNKTNFIIAPAKLYSKDLFKSIRFPIGKIHEDEFTTYRILFPLDKIAFIDTRLYYYRLNPNSITRTSWSKKTSTSLQLDLSN